MNNPLETRMNGPVAMADTPAEGVAFVDRVRALRMPGRADPGKGGGGSWVPWVLCGLLAACSLSLAVRYYARPPAPRDDAGTAPAAGAATAAATDPGAAARPAMPSKKGGPAGAVVHEAWGYIIPVCQTPVSPVEVSGRIVDLRIRE